MKRQSSVLERAHARQMESVRTSKAATRMCRQDAQTFAALDVPYADGFVEGAADDEVGLWVERAVEDV
jgi:hypothetical protein